MRRLRSSFSLAHLLMLVAGLVTFVATAVVLRDSSATVEVVVAAADLQAGTELANAQTATIELAANDPLLDQFLPAGSQLEGQHLSHSVSQGQPILVQDLAAASTSSGGRTITVPAEAYVVTGLGLGVGDRVDLISADIASNFVVAGVEIVRLPQAEALAGFGAVSASSWITVKVSSDEALAIATSIATGPIEVVRSTGAVPVEIGEQS